jgi:hypothetical protein
MDLRIAKQGTGWFVLRACATSVKCTARGAGTASVAAVARVVRATCSAFALTAAVLAMTAAFVIGIVGTPGAAAQSLLPIYEKGTAAFEEEYSIGGDIDDTDNFLFHPSDLALDAEGNLYVLDYKGFCIKKFDRDGNYVAAFGRKGEGPGEMLAAYDMAMDPDGNLVIYDFQNSSRFSVFAPDGEFLESFTLPDVGFRSLTGFGFTPDGSLYASIDFTDYSHPDGKTSTTIARFDPDTRAETPVESVDFQKWYAAQEGDMMMMVSTPFYADLLWGIAPSGNIVTANSDTYTIKIYSPALELVTEIQHDAEKPKVTDEDKEEYLEAFEEGDARIMAKKRARFPKHKPFFDALLIDEEGYLIFRTGETEGDRSVYDVFTPGGKFVNTIMMPGVHPSAIFVDGVVYTIERHDDETDPTVHRYRIK